MQQLNSLFNKQPYKKSGTVTKNGAAFFIE